ncbi:MAG: hypothetical protein AAGD38_16380 [Acidobacteriota bacterium]
MAKNYRIEMGVNWDRKPIGGSSYYYLDHYCVDITAAASLATYRNFSIDSNGSDDDTIKFVVYDITATDHSLSYANFNIHFFSGVAAQQVDLSPLTGLAGDGADNLLSLTSSSETSLVFSTIRNQHRAGNASYAFSNIGNFLFTVVVDVTKGSTTRTYTFDPEMVVGEGSGGTPC